MYLIVEFQILDFDGLEISAAVETLNRDPVWEVYN